MSFLPFSRKTPKKEALRKPSRNARGNEKSELTMELERVRKEKEQADRKAAEIQAQIDDIPRKIKKHEEEERRKIRDRATKTPTMQGLGRPVHKLNAVVRGVKLTRGQQRVLRNRFLMLCALLAAVLFFLWRTVR